MRVLLVIPKDTTTGEMLAKGFINLGHKVSIINGVERDLSKENFDLTMVWSNKIPLPENLPGIKVLHFLDDPEFWRACINGFSLEASAKGYDYVTTNIKWDTFDPTKFTWLPYGCLPELHKKIESIEDEFKSDVCFIGTNRGNRAQLIQTLVNGLKGKTFKIWGNNWENTGITSKAIYFWDYTKAISGSKIFITEHYSNIGSTKDFEVPAVGGALMISDRPKIKEIYPMIPVYETYQEAVDLALYYLDHEEERLKLVKEMQKIAIEQYSYENQINKLLRLINKV